MCVRPPLLQAQLVFLSAALSALGGNDKETWTERICPSVQHIVILYMQVVCAVTNLFAIMLGKQILVNACNGVNQV